MQTDAAPGTIAAVIASVATGLPYLVIQLVATLLLLAIGVAIYSAVTPFNERRLIGEGNAAAGTVLGGATVALAIPLATILATTGSLLAIVIWGVVALVLQLLTFALVSLLLRNLRTQIEAGQVGPAIVLAASHIAVALINAAAMVPT
jgi:putative membrane protein